MVACFGLNGLSFLAVIVAILSLHVRHVPPALSRRLHEDLRSGLGHVRRHAGLMGLTTLGFTTAFLGTPLLTFLPLYADDVFGGGVGQYTYLMMFAGTGAVTGALVAAWLGHFRHMGRTVLCIQLAYGTFILLFGLTQVLWLNALLLVAAGACMVMVNAMLSSLVQLNAPSEMRGRVVSSYLVAFRGGMPLGSLVAGWVATWTSAPTMLSINGVVLGAVALTFLVKGHGVRDL
jgi:predicted MFS family arabinose efflux permease